MVDFLENIIYPSQKRDRIEEDLCRILPLRYSNTESEGLSIQHGTLALLDGLLLLTLLPKLDKAIASASQTAVKTPVYTSQRSILGI